MANINKPSGFDRELKKINAQGKNLFNSQKPPNLLGGFKMEKSGGDKLREGYISYLDKMNAAMQTAQKYRNAAQNSRNTAGKNAVSNIEPIFKTQMKAQPVNAEKTAAQASYRLDQNALRQADQKLQAAKAQAAQRAAQQAQAAQSAAKAAADEAAKKAAAQNNEVEPPSALDTDQTATGSKITILPQKLKRRFM